MGTKYYENMMTYGDKSLTDNETIHLGTIVNHLAIDCNRFGSCFWC